MPSPPLTGRVEDWRAGRPRCPDRSTFPAPSTSVGSRTGAPVLVEMSRPCHVSSPRHVERNVRICRIALPPFLHVEVYGTYPAETTFGQSPTPSSPAEVLSLVSIRSCRPTNASPFRPSPRRIFSASGPANHWTPLSSRPCLPLYRRRYKWQVPLLSTNSRVGPGNFAPSRSQNRA